MIPLLNISSSYNPLIIIENLNVPSDFDPPNYQVVNWAYVLDFYVTGTQFKIGFATPLDKCSKTKGFKSFLNINIKYSNK